MSLALRPYQEDALAAITAAEARGIRRQLVALPTGTGKTVIFAELIRRRVGRALVLVHRDELARQAVDKLSMVGVSGAGVVKAEANDVGAAVIVGSVQTLARPRRLEQLAPDFRTVVVDEAHHAVAQTYRIVLDHVAAESAPLIVGVTATAERGDGSALGAVFDEIVFERPLLGMIREGYLADLRAVQVRIKADFGALHTRAGDFESAEAEALLLDADAPAAVAAAYHEHAAGRKALIFTPTVRVAHAMSKALVDTGVPAEAVDGETPIELRREILARFSGGETQVLCNCGVLTEGYDEPSVDCIVVARPTKSRPLYIQMVGRGTRRHPGKADCLILDVVGATTRHDLQTAATLFGVPADGAITTSVLDAVEAVQRTEAEAAARGALVAQTVELFRAAPLNWVAVRPGRFALALGEGGTLLLDGVGNRWAVRQAPRERGGAVVTIERDLDLPYAQGVAEDIARRQGARTLVDRAAGWRQTAASPRQIDALRRCRVAHGPDLTKGDAADLLTAAIARRWQ